MTLTAFVLPPTGLHRVVSVTQLSLLLCQLFHCPSCVSVSHSGPSVLLALHVTHVCPSCRVPGSCPSSRWVAVPHLHLPHVQKLKHALVLKLMAFGPTCCPPFFCWFIFPDQELLLPFLLRPPFGVQGLLHGRTRFYLQVLDCSLEDTLCRCSPCPAERCLVYMHIHLCSIGKKIQ